MNDKARDLETRSKEGMAALIVNGETYILGTLTQRIKKFMFGQIMVPFKHYAQRPLNENSWTRVSGNAAIDENDLKKNVQVYLGDEVEKYFNDHNMADSYKDGLGSLLQDKAD